MSIRKRLSIIAIVLVAALTAIGCDTQEEVSTAPVAEETPTPAPEEVEEEVDETEAEVEDDGPEADLMDYYGQSIEDVSSLFPTLEIMSNEGYYDKNGTVYIDKEEEFDGVLSGPEFDTDSDSNIVGITYSGRRFAVAGLSAAMTVEEAIETLKQDGWTFSEIGVTHGTAQYYAVYSKDDLELSFVSTDAGEFGKDKESDLTGSVESVSVAKRQATEEYAKAYLEKATELNDAGTTDLYALIDVDGDGTPELVAADSEGSYNEEGNVFLYTFTDKGIVELSSVTEGLDGNRMYVSPLNSFVLKTSSMSGNERYECYSVKEGKLELVKELQALYDPDKDSYTYQDKNNKITQKQYQDEFDKEISVYNPMTELDHDGYKDVNITLKDGFVDFESFSTQNYMSFDDLKKKLM